MFAYFDETETPPRAAEPITGVAGYLFSKDGAKLFRQIFNETISLLIPPDKHGERIFHATKCIGRHDHCSALTVPESEHITNLMVNAISRSATLGVVVLMPKKRYEDAVKRSPAIRQLAGSEYSVCLIRCIENMAAWMDKTNMAGRIQFVFESGSMHEREANRIMQKISASDELKKRYRLRSYEFIDKCPDLPQLFAPDLLAWEAQREHVNGINPQRGEHRTIVSKLFSAVPHIPEYENDTTVGMRAFMNLFYRVTPIDIP